MPSRSTIASVIAAAGAFLGLAVSIASLVDMQRPAPAFCSEAGCATVRASAWAHPLGIPMPALGIAFFAVMIALAWSPYARARRVLAIAGGLWALGLIALQAFVIGAWCKLCMIADPAAIVLAVAVAAGATRVRFRWVHAALVAPGVGALTAGLGFALAAPPLPPVPSGTPACVAQAQVAGAVTIVELDDFECPFCRALHPALAAAIAQASTPVHLVRKMVPLPRHEHAQTAAIAWSCADAQGRGDAMADALFAAPPSELTTDGCERIAVQLGCDADRYREARADPAIARRVAQDVAEAKAAGVAGLPTVFVGGTRLDGAAHGTAELVALIAHTPR